MVKIASMDHSDHASRRALFARWKRRSPSFPWITSVVGAAILTASAPPSGVREGISYFLSYWGMVVVLGFIGGLIFASVIGYVVSHDDPDKIINAARLTQVVMILAVVWLWGWAPSQLPGDPGDRGYP